jgi:histidinol-phosphate aminotransferase
MDIQTLIRPHLVASLEPYIPIEPFEVLSARLGRPPEAIIKLDANENPYGPSPKVRTALANLPYAHIYPDPASTALRAALAKSTGLPVENLLAGAGADDLIDLILRLFIGPGDAILNCPPTFSMYAFDAALNAAQIISIPRRPNFSLDMDQVEGAFRLPARRPPPKLIFLASPNNPDGSVVSDADLRRLLALPAGIVLDEAYVEFQGTASASRLPWVLEHDNLMVLRTFSKNAGLAGLRVGYGAFSQTLTPHLWKIKQPYSVSIAASAAAIAALDDPDYLNQIVAQLTAERERLTKALTKIPYLRPYPSRANFVLCRVVGRDARTLKLALESEGILVRHYTAPDLNDCLRISVGKPEHTDALIQTLQRL